MNSRLAASVSPEGGKRQYLPLSFAAICPICAGKCHCLCGTLSGSLAPAGSACHLTPLLRLHTFPQGANVFCTDLHSKDIMQNFSKLILPSVRGFGKRTFLGIGPEFKQADLTVLYFILFYCIAFFIFLFHCILYTVPC